MAQAIKPAELMLAKQLIDSQTVTAYNPSAYADEHKVRLETAIEAKVNGVALPVEADATPSSDPVDLMAALQASLTKAA